MSYLVFARKWRPLTFDDVVGQEHITDTLKKAIEKNRVAHAYIFSGTRGVGKTTTARILARALNCDAGPTPTPCGECNSCKNIISGSSFDVLEIDGASNNSVDDIRELRDNIGYSSMGGKYRIFVIDEVHMLSKSAFNALLKTLEEPPKNVIFIFATTEPQKIPATIHSRCQRYDFRRIGAEQILDRLVHICTTEKITFERSALMLIARKAEGSMRDALSLLDQVFSFCHESLTEKEARSVLGLVGLDVFNEVMDAIASKNPAPALKAVQDVLYQGFDLQEFILGLQEHIRNLLFARIPAALESRGVDLEPQTAQEFVKSSGRFSEGDLLRMAEIVKKAEQDLKWSAFPRFLVELTLLKLVMLDNTVSIEKLLLMFGGSKNASSEMNEDIGSEKKKIELADPEPHPYTINLPGSQSTTVKEEAPTIEEQASPEITDEEFQFESSAAEDTFAIPEKDSFIDNPVKKTMLSWPDFLDNLMKDRPNIGSFLSLAKIITQTENIIELKFPSHCRFQYTEITKKGSRDEITKRLNEFAGTPIELRITIDSKAPENESHTDLKPRVNTYSTINDEIEKEPIIQTVIDVFNGDILQ